MKNRMYSKSYIMKNFLLIFCLMANIYLYGQVTFEKKYNDGYSDVANVIRQCPDKGYIILGTSRQESGTQYAYLTKTDSLGEIEWSKYFYSIYRGNSIENDYNGGFIMVGYESYVNGKLLVLNLDSSGNIIWSKGFNYNYSYIEGNNIVQTLDSNYVITGTCEVSSGNRDIFLLKLDSNGDSLWTKTYGDSGFDVEYDMKKTNEDGFIVAGTSQLGYHGEYKLNIIKINGYGNIIWSRTYNEGFEAFSIDLTSDNGYVVLGYKYGTLMMKVDSAGNVKWTKMLIGFQGSCVIETTDNGFFATGGNFYQVKTDSTGNIMWEQNPGEKHPGGYSKNCIQTIDYGLATIGHYYDNDYQKETILFIKTDINGCICPTIKNISGPKNVTVNQPSEFKVQLNYGTDTLQYNWNLNNGQIVSGQNSSLISVIWSQTGTDTLRVSISNDCGSDSLLFPVNILDCVTPLTDSIYGNLISHFSTENYFVNKIEGSEPIVYNWISDIAHIIEGNGTDSITVEWMHEGTGYIQMTAENMCGQDSLVKYVTVILTSINEMDNAQILIYPNPTLDGKFNFETTKAYEKLSILSLNGQLLYEKGYFGNSGQVNLSALPKGIYILKLFLSNMSIARKLIIL